MQCASCGTDNASGARFCKTCGAPLGARCPACGQAADADARFCSHCGAPIAESTAAGVSAALTSVRPAPTTPVEAVAERRVCSVLFCDLVGFTPLAESRDPEEVRELLSRYFDAARTVIDRYGGAVEKFIGDAVMAVWGAPTAAEGDAERAVRAALDVVETVAELGRQAGAVELSARAGVVTGEVAVTVGAEGQGMVAGDAVNTAARVQAVAAPGSVLVDEGTWRLARGAVAFGARAEHHLKGKSEPVGLWPAQRVVSGVGGSQRIDGLEAPLVGRDAELRLVKELFHACVDRRSARLVSVTGPAGVGKSRLGWEFEKYVDGLAATVNWHRGRCLAYGEGVAFWALAEMIRQRLAIAEEESATVAGSKLDDGLGRLLPDPAVREYVRPRLARLLGVEGEGPALGRDELFAGWRLFLERLAAAAPVVLLIEDLHHADSGLLDFLEYLLDWARDVPIFVLTLARAELDDQRPGWSSGRRNGTSLALEPLDEAAMAAMLDGLVPGMPARAKAAVSAQAQGIPLYAVETVRMLVDRDVVQPIDGVYRLVSDIDELAVPETLQSLLAARLDSLEPDARRLVADAAVLGGTFPVEALVAVSGLPGDRVATVLADLVRREVLGVRADRLSPERGQYGFVQNLFRQVAYATMSRRERKSRHLGVAEYLTVAFPDDGEEVTEVIARHLLDALAAVPDDPDVEDLRERAVAFLVRAGDRGRRTGAPAAAAAAYSAAAELASQEATAEAALRAGRLFEKAGAATSFSAGWHSGAEVHFRRAGELFRAHSRWRDAARADVGLAEVLRREGHFQAARELMEPALETLRTEPDEDTVEALSAVATLEAFAGNGEEATVLVHEAFGLAQALDLTESRFADLFQISGFAYNFARRRVQSLAAFREAVRRARLSGDSFLVGRALLNLADVLLHTDPAAAGEAAAEAATLLRRVGNRYGLPIALDNLVQALLLSGDWVGAEREVREGLEEGLASAWGLAWSGVVCAALRGDLRLADELAGPLTGAPGTEDPQVRSGMASALGIVAALRGDHRAALDYAWEALGHGDVSTEAGRWAWSAAAEAALALGEPAEVDRLLAWVDRHPPGHRPPLLRAERLRIHARLAAARGDPDAAAGLEAAVAALREVGSPYHLAVGLLDQADQLAADGQGALAGPLAAEAAEIASRLGAGPLAARAAALSERLGARSARADGGREPAVAGFPPAVS